MREYDKFFKIRMFLRPKLFTRTDRFLIPKRFLQRDATLSHSDNFARVNASPLLWQNFTETMEHFRRLIGKILFQNSTILANLFSYPEGSNWTFIDGTIFIPLRQHSPITTAHFLTTKIRLRPKKLSAVIPSGQNICLYGLHQEHISEQQVRTINSGFS